MPLEIERKFLVVGDSWRGAATGSTLIRQGYLFSNETISFRVRIMDETRAVTTLKAGGGAVSRSEFEYEIPLADARELITIAAGRTIEKRRHDVPVQGKDWVVDEFLGRHAGLVLAELELESEDEQFGLPDWVGQEVTADPRYRNGALSLGG